MGGVWELIAKAIPIGIGATLLFDIWQQVLRFALSGPAPSWKLPGRWFGYMPRLTFVHPEGVAKAAPLPGEDAIGWIMHYVVGISFAVALLAIWGTDWTIAPTFGPALIVGLVTVGLGWFLMQPAMGNGVACNRAPNPTKARALGIIAHVVFAIGLYGTALLLA
ncbi:MULTISPECIES: DUF2938 family protein [unclassified Chelatococcus]|uniref:DUF2938 family protein n=1 Tax=unclassified Chelatococcus TaxID=2638111 RepID=UPI001BD06E76|nr:MULTISPECIES: DUF2938 family protein [unclassified Chelatococcus]MBS7700989.1 DUF2938 domain-containing protein [Chelatococcus sp. YT9]MBX3555522.1 DUF2938 domain-containing protein [Chelatococcus sp.]